MRDLRKASSNHKGGNSEPRALCWGVWGGGGPCEFQLIVWEFSQKEMRRVLSRHLKLTCGGRETEPARNDKELGVALAQSMVDGCRKGR